MRKLHTVLLVLGAAFLAYLVWRTGMEIYSRETYVLPSAAAERGGFPAEIRDLTDNPIHHPCV